MIKKASEGVRSGINSFIDLVVGMTNPVANKDQMAFEASLFLMNVKHSERFVSNDGIHFQNMEELFHSLADMDGSTFSHHVNSERNDFASWVEHCIGDDKLVSTMKACGHDKEKMAAAVGIRVKELMKYNV